MKIKNLLNIKSNIKIKLLNFDEYKNHSIIYFSNFFVNEKIDSIIFLKENKPIYIITSTDLLEIFLTHKENLSLNEIFSIYQKDIITLKKDDLVIEAYKIMRKLGIEHLIIVDDSDKFLKVINYHTLTNFLTEIAIKDEYGLFNKKFFEFIVDKYEGYNNEIGIIFIDLDDFKKINDTFGHKMGDKVLDKVSEIIKNSIRAIDYAFRFGGDEFVILTFSNKEISYKIANRILEKINLLNFEFKVKASIGVAHYPSDLKKVSEVVTLADKKLYVAKKEKNKVV